ncbi:MAG: sensor histidine kinase [bacterium]
MIPLQVYLLDNAFELKRQAFRQNVNSALSTIVQKLETRETIATMFRVTVNDSSHENKMTVNMEVHTEQDSNESAEEYWVSTKKMDSRPNLDLANGKITFNLSTPQQVRIVVLDSLGQEVEDIEEFKPAGQHEIQLSALKTSSCIVHFTFMADSTSYLMRLANGRKTRIIQNPATSDKRRLIVEKVLDELTTLNREPIAKRIDPVVLDSLISTTLKEKDITTPYAYGIVSVAKDSVIMAEPEHLKHEIYTSEFKNLLFPNDLFVEKNNLVLYFPQQTVYLFKQISVLVITALIFVLVIGLCFIYTIRTIFKQKEFATRLTSFINNMTHEFKTPISTIALASENLSNPAIRQNEQKLLHYNRIIQDENLRMRSQVEKILEMAVLEEGDYELNLTRVDVHRYINKAIQKVALQIAKRNGKIISKLSATCTIVEADSLHFTNIIHNLLDNAMKYTRNTPEILIGTENINGCIKIRVEDNGIGLSPEEQNHVFDKYYRVPTGNLHDVKGFGLGLTYVKLLVEVHGGTIHLQSEVNKGTVFEIVLPLTQKQN